MPRNNKKIKGAPAPARSRGPGKPSGQPSNPPKGQNGNGQSQSQGQAKETTVKKGSVQANQRPIVPFLRKDRVLLVGEGDFSFARSLATQYKCRNLCATCYDSKDTLEGKYPQAQENIQAILEFSKKPKKETETENGIEESKDSTTQKAPKVLFSVDARKLGSPGGGAKEIRTGFHRHERKRPGWFQPKTPDPPYQSGGPWDVICFNFPHVGGLSTDVNRQVRANQELLVAFFKACVPLVSKAPPLMDADEDEWEISESEDDDEDDDEEGEGGDETTGKGIRTGAGQILVTLFEAEPYTLWNIKDLARHAGLIVVTSFRFPWASYEGYSHARTIGEIEGKNGERGGWRGEDRDARMYVFEVKEKPKWKQKGKFNKKTQKRERDDSSSDSD
ncbi:hypothetical protein PENANT_c033G04419 [Penicillium antarcticum]|uniref:25S rRNA (uridine-N(3))-methyltransferase BMT5-like domain-containing protein n=1 Tax=Penicillium antarcticum TaxID=416450 RepID=A0A1V6PUZ2_9EURO|nr:uncharacterized protein N7508_000818 [Penicillium antarcticum]KAJ5320535.1 hypothetical protein N7508_000818 [Penicillium antarcticum]OQD80773.1 hypothetical protein PENANT_c033G04419 [Penicillium antarcticum]